MSHGIWTAWHKPPGKPTWWELIGGAATERDARRLMLADGRSGGFLTLAPGKPPPTPNREPVPAAKGEA